MSKTVLAQKIQDKIASLYMLDPKMEKQILDNLHKFPLVALKEIIVILEDAERKQEEFIKKANSKNKNFSKELKLFLDKEYKKATDDLTEQEHQGADKLLNY